MVTNERLLRNCIYCDKSIVFSYSKKYCDDICCITADRYKCKKILSCGHDCYLVNTSSKCFCLIGNCKNNKSYTNSIEELCVYCTDPLLKFPVVKLDCNHIFHHKCVSQLFQSNSISKGDEISTSFAKCSLCFSKITCLNHLDINVLVEFYDNINKKIENLIYIRLEKENINEHPDITDENGKYHNKPFEWCVDKMRFYLCFKCELPYYGGLKNCQEEIFQESGEKSNEKSELLVSNQSVNKKSQDVLSEVSEEKQNVLIEISNNVDLIRASKICINCLDNSQIQGNLNCDVHGREFILFKCKFCCSPASHFCWGTTHFCEDCHFKQLSNNTLITKLKLDDLPKCDPNNCFLKGIHPINGYEYAIGCGECKTKLM